jgi:hypothetical protein
MAPPRKKRPAPGEGREYKLRLPLDIANRIEAKAKAEQRPQNRIIVNELAEIPHLERFRDLAGLVGDMQVILARHGARIMWHDLSDQLLNGVDAVLDAEGGALLTAVEKLRAARTSMLNEQRKLRLSKDQK